MAGADADADADAATAAVAVAVAATVAATVADAVTGTATGTATEPRKSDTPWSVELYLLTTEKTPPCVRLLMYVINSLSTEGAL